MIKTIDKTTAKMLGEQAANALQELAERHGLTIEFGGGRYDPTAGTYSPKITFKVADSAEQEFRHYAEMFGLEADDWQKEFKVGVKTFQISGLATRSRTRPILATSAGKTYKFTTGAVKRALGRKVEPWEV